MENLDGTIIATAAPRMARSFGVPSVELNVAITAYLLALGVFIPVSGWIADRFRRPVRVLRCHCPVHGILGPLCAQHEPRRAHRGTSAARHGRGDDGACRAPRGPACRGQDGHHPGDRLSHLAGAHRAGHRAGARRRSRDLRILALDLRPQSPAWASSRCSSRCASFPTCDQTDQRGLDWRGFVLTGAGLGAFVYGLELVTDGSVSWAAVGAGVGVGAVLIWWAVIHLQRTTHPIVGPARAAHRDVPVLEPGWLLLPVGDQCRALPAGAHVPERLRLESSPIGPARHRGVRRQHHDQALHDTRSCTGSDSGRYSSPRRRYPALPWPSSQVSPPGPPSC